jgi:hypothetical chaperone protein
MIIGMDFGTTNTGAALFDGERVHLLPIDPHSPTPEVCRSAVYMSRTGDYHLGSQAMSLYFAQNIGRPTRFRKIWVGQIIQVFAELPVFYRDVYVYEDEFSPGRLFTSIKTALRSRDYQGTVFRGNWYNASDLVAIFLMGARLQMERQIGKPVTDVVLGRPVYFSIDSTEDRVAQSRLLDSAFKAGFEKVYLEYEPVAAALAYEQSLSQPETILVFDFGGGTLDFTIMEIGRPGKRQVLATGGVPIAGDIFDQRLFRVTIPRHLGEGDEFISNGDYLPIPAHIFDTLAQPSEILSLNTPQNLEMLRKINAEAIHKEKTQALLKVVSSNYALMLFDLVEQTKRQLTVNLESDLLVSTPDFAFQDRVSRMVFERAIATEAETIRSELLATLDKTGYKPTEIDRVVRTGGSSQIPLFVNLLSEIFGVEKVRAIDTFSSVTSGLAIRGHRIASGDEEIPVFTPDSAWRSQEQAVGVEEESTPKPVVLESVYKRLGVQMDFIQQHGQLPKAVLFALDKGSVQVTSFDLPLSKSGWQTSASQSLKGSLSGLNMGAQILLAQVGDDVLLATNQYKLILASVRDLYLAQQAATDGIIQSLPLEPDESISAIMGIKPQSTAMDFVCIVTAIGQGRAFDARMLMEYMSRRPYFRLERRYTSVPAALFPASAGDSILIGTNRGRLGLAPISEMAVMAYDLLRIKRGESVSAWMSVGANATTAAISSAGYRMNFDPRQFASSGAPATRGKYLRSNFPIIAIHSANELATKFVVGVTNLGRLYPLHDVSDRGVSAQQVGARKVVKLAAQETLIGCLKLDNAENWLP